MLSTNINVRRRLDKEIAFIFKDNNVERIQNISNNKITYSSFLSDKLLMITMIRQGVPYSLFNLIQHYTPFSETDWAAFLDISTKSLQRYKQSSKHFKSIQSEKIIEMAEVTNVGLDVFGDMDKLKLWLHTPNYALANTKPFDLLKDSYGKEMVIAELVRINHGILA